MDATTFKRFRRALIAWYVRAARDLPWRRTRDPYCIWLSEIMLQQTTVAAVVPYYERFLNRFPTVADLAAASEEEVLRLWEGLGYYSRARNLHKAAKAICDGGSGELPRDVDALRELPGVGRYTAGAIASFAFDRRAPIVEANTLRLYARLLCYDGDPRSTDGQRRLWEFAENVLPLTSPGRFNQALMELGATVCMPASPACAECPVRTCCGAFAANRQDSIPLAAKRAEISDVAHAAVMVEVDGRWLLRQCGPAERWAGLWDFPRVELDQSVPEHAAGSRRRIPPRVTAEVSRLASEQTGIEIVVGALHSELRHTVTRYRIRLLCFHGSCDLAKSIAGHGRAESPSTNGSAILRWATPAEMESIPLSTTGRKMAQSLKRTSSASTLGIPSSPKS